MENEDIERRALACVWQTLSSNEKLDASLSVNDKTPIVDGEVKFYTPDKSNKTKNFQWAVPVQLKGHELKKKETFKNSPKFKLEKRYLQAFQGYGGVLLLVVHIKDNECRTYYRILGPFDIEHELRLMGGRKSRRVSLTAFPTKHEEQIGVVKLAHQKCRPSDIVVSSDMMALASGVRVSTTTAVDFSKPGRIGVGADSPAHIELTLRDGNQFPIRGLIQFWPEKYVPHELGSTLRSGNVVVKDAHRRFIEDQYLEIAISPNFRLVINSGLTEGAVHFVVDGPFIAALTDLEFLSSWVAERSFEIGGHRVSWGFEQTDFSALDANLRIFRDVNALCEKLGVDTSLLRVEDLADAGDSLENIVKYFVYGGTLTIPTHSPAKMLVEMGEWQLRFFVSGSCIDGKAVIRSVGDTQAEQLWWVENKEPQDRSRITAFEVLTVEEISTTLNLNLGNIVESYERFVDDQYRTSYANDTVLKLIQAADLQPKRRQEFLCAAQKLAELVMEDRALTNIAKLNLWQIGKRLGRLADTDLREIRQFRESLSPDDSSFAVLKAGASILLGQRDEVDFWLNQASCHDRMNMQATPIYQLYQCSELESNYRITLETSENKWEQYRRECMDEDVLKEVQNSFGCILPPQSLSKRSRY